MKRTLAAGLVLVAILSLACGGDDDGGSDAPDPTASAPPELVEELAEVCTQGPEVATDDILIVQSPEPGERVTSPIVVRGNAVSFQDTVWVSVVKAGGERIIDYPGRTDELNTEDTFAPYEVSVPFTVVEETPACLWVYRQNRTDPPEARKIPVVLVPAPSPTP